MKLYEINLTQFHIFSELLIGMSVLYLLFYSILTSQTTKNYAVEIVVQDCIIFFFVILCAIFFKECCNNCNYLSFQESIVVDYVAFFSKYVIILSSIICLIMVKHYINYRQINFFEYSIIFLFSILSLLILCSTYDFITAYLIIEFQSLTFYFLSASKKNSFSSIKSGLKYFILGSFSSGLLLFGISLSYGYMGSTNFKNFFVIFEKITNPLNVIIYFNYNFIQTMLSPADFLELPILGSIDRKCDPYTSLYINTIHRETYIQLCEKKIVYKNEFQDFAIIYDYHLTHDLKQLYTVLPDVGLEYPAELPKTKRGQINSIRIRYPWGHVYTMLHLFADGRIITVLPEGFHTTMEMITSQVTDPSMRARIWDHVQFERFVDFYRAVGLDIPETVLYNLRIAQILLQFPDPADTLYEKVDFDPNISELFEECTNLTHEYEGDAVRNIGLNIGGAGRCSRCSAGEEFK